MCGLPLIMLLQVLRIDVTMNIQHHKEISKSERARRVFDRLFPYIHIKKNQLHKTVGQKEIPQVICLDPYILSIINNVVNFNALWKCYTQNLEHLDSIKIFLH